MAFSGTYSVFCEFFVSKGNLLVFSSIGLWVFDFAIHIISEDPCLMQGLKYPRDLYILNDEVYALTRE